MTPEQHRLLVYLGGYIQQHGYSPSYAECAEHMGIATKSGIHRLVNCLEKAGKVRRLPHVARSLEVVPGALPKHPGLAERLAKAVVDAHGVDDGDGVLVIATEAEVLDALRTALGETAGS